MDKTIKRLVVLALGCSVGCVHALKVTPSDADVVLSQHALQAPDPGRRGPFSVLTLYYGSGTDAGPHGAASRRWHAIAKVYRMEIMRR